MKNLHNTVFYVASGALLLSTAIQQASATDTTPLAYGNYQDPSENYDGVVTGHGPAHKLIQVVDEYNNPAAEAYTDAEGRYYCEGLNVKHGEGVKYRLFTPSKGCYSAPFLLNKNNPYRHLGDFKCESSKPQPYKRGRGHANIHHPPYSGRYTSAGAGGNGHVTEKAPLKPHKPTPNYGLEYQKKPKHYYQEPKHYYQEPKHYYQEPKHYPTAPPPQKNHDVVFLKAKHSHKCLDVSTISKHDGANIHQWSCVNGANQKWKVKHVKNGFSLQAKHSHKCMDVSGVSHHKGANVHQWSCYGGKNQIVSWKGSQLVFRHSGLCLTVEHGSHHDGASFIQDHCKNKPNQQFSFVKVPHSTPKHQHKVVHKTKVVHKPKVIHPPKVAHKPYPKVSHAFGNVFSGFGHSGLLGGFGKTHSLGGFNHFPKLTTKKIHSHHYQPTQHMPITHPPFKHPPVIHQPVKHHSSSQSFFNGFKNFGGFGW